MKVYQALYCSCIHKSAFGTLSVHKTRKGANKAVANHINQEYKCWLQYKKWCDKNGMKTIFAQHEDWAVQSFKIED